MNTRPSEGFGLPLVAPSAGAELLMAPFTLAEAID